MRNLILGFVIFFSLIIAGPAFAQITVLLGVVPSVGTAGQAIFVLVRLSI